MDIEQFEAILNILEIGESSKSALVEAYRNAIQRAENREGRIKSIRDQNAEHLQSEIDRLIAQNLQLRLICDRAVTMLLGSDQFDQSQLNEITGPIITGYLDSIKYEDVLEVNPDGSTMAIAKFLCWPLMGFDSTGDGKTEANLLELAMAEQNRKKLVEEEIQQLEEIKKLKPECGPQVDMATWAFRFAREAGGVTSSQELFDLYSPAVNLARSAAK